MLFERGANLRQKMNSGGTVLGLRVDNFLVPHGTLHRQGVAVNVFPLQAAKFCERKTRPRLHPGIESWQEEQFDDQAEAEYDRLEEQQEEQQEAE
jgi:hypothetical protein